MLDISKGFDDLIETIYVISSFSMDDIDSDDDILTHVIGLLNEFHGNICTDFDENILNLLKEASPHLDEFTKNIENFKRYINVNSISDVNEIRLLFDIDITDMKKLVTSELALASKNDYDIEISKFYDTISENIIQETSFGYWLQPVTDIDELIEAYPLSNILSKKEGASTKFDVTKQFELLLAKYASIFNYAKIQLDTIYIKIKESRDFTITEINKSVDNGNIEFDQISLSLLRATLFIARSYVVLYLIFKLYLTVMITNIKVINVHLEKLIQ